MKKCFILLIEYIGRQASYKTFKLISSQSICTFYSYINVGWDKEKRSQYHVHIRNYSPLLPLLGDNHFNNTYWHVKYSYVSSKKIIKCITLTKTGHINLNQVVTICIKINRLNF